MAERKVRTCAVMYKRNLAPGIQRLLRFDADGNPSKMFAGEAADLLNVRQRVYAPGSAIVHQGDVSETVRLVRSGWVFSAIELENGTRQILDIFLMNDLVEPMTVDRYSHVSLHAVDYVTALEFPYDGIALLLARWPERARYFAAEAARLRAIRMERIVSLGRRDATRRTAHLFLEFAERVKPGDSQPAAEYECPLTQADLSDILGMTAIHINRTLRELREMQFVTFRNGNVSIHDRKGLADFAGFSPGYLARPVRLASCPQKDGPSEPSARR